MNDQIKELTELFSSKNVSTIKAGIETLDTFFQQFEFHPMKEEYSNLNRDGKRELVKALLDTTKTTSENEVESILNDDSESTDDTIQQNDLEVKNDSESLEQLLDQERQDLLTERETVMNRLAELNTRLSELGVQSDVGTKMDQVREWRRLNPKAGRAQFMSDMEQLGSKAMLSTYWQKIK